MQLTIIKPIITEASMKDADRGKFTFQVQPDATKTVIKAAIEKAFGVQVKKIGTVTIKRSKTINTKFGRKNTKVTIKKARVNLAKGQTIPAFQEVKQEVEKQQKKSKKETK